MAAAKNNGLRLRITGPDGSTMETIADTESIIVGSGAQAAVKLTDPSVSNLHVMLKVDKEGGVTAIDLGSEAGTQVGDQRLLVPKALVPGDVLKVGSSQVEVLFGEPSSVAPKVPAGAQVNGRSFQGSVTQRAPVPPVPPARPEVVIPSAHRTVAPPGMKAKSLPAVPVVAKRPEVPAHLQEPLPPDALPTPEAKILQVAMLWGDSLLEVKHFREGVPVTIGEGKKNFFHVFVPEVGSRHVLAVGKGEQVELRVPGKAGVIVTSQGDVRTKDALRASGQLASAAASDGQVFTLGLHDRAEVSLGTLAFVVRYVRPSPAIQVSAGQEADFTYFKIACISMLASGALVAAMLLTPRSEAPSADDLLQSQQRVAKFLVTPEKKQELKKLKLAGVEEGAKAKDEEGKFGKEEAKKAEADPSKPGTPVVDKTKREKDRQVVGQVGLLGASRASR
ncbi:FHA domain-containing protein, partial [Stigmatella aurantiaca]